MDSGREEALLMAAAAGFAENGYSNTSLNRVILAAGWGKSSFYHYFEHKRALFDYVVTSLRSRLSDDVELPDLERLTVDDFWSAISDLLAMLSRAAERSPETRFLGQMFYQDGHSESPDDPLEVLRADIKTWLIQAIARGREVGAIRDDLPKPLLVELTTTVLMTLDRWAVNLEIHGPRGVDAAQTSLQLVRDLVEARPGGRNSGEDLRP